MNKKIRVLTINPGSTSTKIALFDDYDKLFDVSVNHNPDELENYEEINDQLEYRTEMIEKVMLDNGYAIEDVEVFSGRGGLFPVAGGVYEVTDLLAEHASQGIAGQHPAQLAPQIIKRYADKFGKRAFVVNPPTVDEFIDVARVMGIKGVYRQSHVHTLNQKEIAMRFCKIHDLAYESTNLVIWAVVFL